MEEGPQKRPKSGIFPKLQTSAEPALVQATSIFGFSPGKFMLRATANTGQQKFQLPWQPRSVPRQPGRFPWRREHGGPAEPVASPWLPRVPVPPNYRPHEENKRELFKRLLPWLLSY